jgi:hypothetical protein
MAILLDKLQSETPWLAVSQLLLNITVLLKTDLG